MAEVLELAHLAQRDGVAEMQVGAGGVDAELDVERDAALELLLESASGTILAAPEVMMRICSSTGNIGAPFCKVIAPSPRAGGNSRGRAVLGNDIWALV